MSLRKRKLLTRSQYRASVIDVSWRLCRRRSRPNSRTQIQWHVIWRIHTFKSISLICTIWRSLASWPAIVACTNWRLGVHDASTSCLLSKWGSIHCPNMVRTSVWSLESSRRVAGRVATVPRHRQTAVHAVILPDGTIINRTAARGLCHLSFYHFISIFALWHWSNVNILLLMMMMMKMVNVWRLWYRHSWAGCDYWWWWWPGWCSCCDDATNKWTQHTFINTSKQLNNYLSSVTVEKTEKICLRYWHFDDSMLGISWKDCITKASTVKDLYICGKLYWEDSFKPKLYFFCTLWRCKASKVQFFLQHLKLSDTAHTARCTGKQQQTGSAVAAKRIKQLTD